MTTLTATALAGRYAVRIDIADLPAGATTISVSRIIDGNVDHVRGARDLLVAGSGGIVTDWETPLGASVTWFVEAMDSTGAVLSTDQVAIEVPGVDMPHVVLSDPLEEASAQSYRAVLGTDETRTWERKLEAVAPSGQRLPRLTVGAQSYGDFTLLLLTETHEAGARLRSFLENAAALMVRPPAGIGLPAVIVGHAGTITESPTVTQGVSVWRLPITRSLGPRIQTLAAAWTYGDLADLGLTYGELSATFPTYRDLQAGPE